MPSAVELLREGNTKDLWQKCCGFVDLTMEQFMTIQRDLLTEQIELLKKCELGNTVMRGAKPRNVEEFRELVPITTYADYAPYLLEQREDVLPEKPILWQRTSGRSGEYPAKWVPVTRRQYEDLGDVFLGVFIIASCRGRGEVIIEEHDKLLYGLAPPPYISGSYLRRLGELGVFEFFPPLYEAEKMSFEERIETGLKMGMCEGMDVLPGITSVLVAIGERFSQGGGLKRAAAALTKPRMLPRLLKAVVKSKLARRPMLPRDIWSLKGLIAGGADNGIYREKIKALWGRYPLDVYGCGEGVLIAMQTWDYEGMTFLPHINFLEFMPEGEWHKWSEDPTYRPTLLLLNEVQAWQNYGVVITNFRGGAFVRYFLGDVVKIKSSRNVRLNIDTPQMVFDSRIDGIIDIAGFTRLTEKTVWQAIEDSGVAYHDWVIRKEERDKPVLALYLECKPGADIVEEQAAAAIHEQLKKLDSDYADLEAMLGLKPLKVTVLSPGAFQAYISKQRAAGADLAHLKPPHVNPPEAAIDTLLTPVH
ncbi:GH3 auxin-responsive promoter family protein [Chloroflexota bacterium]